MLGSAGEGEIPLRCPQRGEFLGLWSWGWKDTPCPALQQAAVSRDNQEVFVPSASMFAVCISFLETRGCDIKRREPGRLGIGACAVLEFYVLNVDGTDLVAMHCCSCDPRGSERPEGAIRAPAMV